MQVLPGAGLAIVALAALHSLLAWVLAAGKPNPQPLQAALPTAAEWTCIYYQNQPAR